MSEYSIKVELKKNGRVFLCPVYPNTITFAKVVEIDIPTSCSSGVFTNTSSMLVDRSVEHEDAIGLKNDLKGKSFAYSKSDLHIIIGNEAQDHLSSSQFGNCQK